MLTLFEHPLSPYAQKIKIALREKGIEFEARLPAGIGSGATPDDVFRSGSPRGEVPLLVGDEGPLFDSTIILEYLEDRFPDPRLRPATPIARAHARTIEEVLDTHYEAITWGLAEIRYFGRASGSLAERLEEAAATQLVRLHSWLGERLGDAEWLGGESFGWADVCAVPFVNGASGFGLGPASDSPLGRWLERANARPGVAATSAEAEAARGAMAGVARLVEAGAFRREYRDHRLEWMVRAGGLEVVEKGIEAGNIRFVDFPPRT